VLTTTPYPPAGRSARMPAAAATLTRSDAGGGMQPRKFRLSHWYHEPSPRYRGYRALAAQPSGTGPYGAHRAGL